MKIKPEPVAEKLRATITFEQLRELVGVKETDTSLEIEVCRPRIRSEGDETPGDQIVLTLPSPRGRRTRPWRGSRRSTGYHGSGPTWSIRPGGRVGTWWTRTATSR